MAPAGFYLTIKEMVEPLTAVAVFAACVSSAGALRLWLDNRRFVRVLQDIALGYSEIPTSYNAQG